jgi:hypothetical protein
MFIFNKEKKYVIIIAILIKLSLIIFGLNHAYNNNQNVVFTNKSGKSLAELNLLICEKAFIVKDFKHEQSQKFDFKPDNDCSFRVIIFDEKGYLVLNATEGYVTPGMNASHKLELTKSFEVIWD